MSLSRYEYSKKVTYGNKTVFGTNKISSEIYNAVESNLLKFETHTLKEGERLDTIAGKFYGDSGYWWIIAAASGIGWPLQVPPGTFLKIPMNLNNVFGLIL
tara:strand:- start:1294 stop:1596 length:303 start_codon:yes stop_codon:yes gene_type:complete